MDETQTSLEEQINQRIRENKDFLVNEIGVTDEEIRSSERNIERVLCLAEKYFKVDRKDYKSIANLWRVISSQYYIDTRCYLEQDSSLEIIDMEDKDIHLYFRGMVKYVRGETK